MTATTKTQLQRLPAAFGVLVITCIIRYFFSFFETAPTEVYWPYYPAFFVTGAGVLLAMGILLDAIPTARMAILVQAGVTIFHFLLDQATGQATLPPPAEVALSLYYNIELLPFIFFVSRHTRQWKQQRIWLIAAVFVLYRGLMAYEAGFALNMFTPIDFSNWLTDLINITLKIASCSSFVLLLTELTAHADRNEKPALNKLTISSGDHFASPAIVFFSLKSLLLISPFFLSTLLSEPPSAQMATDYDWALFLLRLDWILSILCCIMALAAGVIYLRTQILAFLLRFGISLRAAFWLLTLPLIGFIAWLIISATGKAQTDKSQQLIALKKFRQDSLFALIILASLAYILGAIWLNQYVLDEGFLYILAGSAALFLISIANRRIYYLQLGIQLLVIIYFITSRLLDGQSAYSTFFNADRFNGVVDYWKFMFIVQLAMLGASWSLLLSPALDPDYYKTEDEKISSEDHLFAEHELQQ